MKISVVIPVFNGEKYISKCIDSILKQSYSDFEIVVVNDGSTDKTAEILNEYKNANLNFRVFEIQNCGVNQARYHGFVNSKGDYITFVDADDWIENNYFSEISPYFEDGEADIIITGLIREFNEDNRNKNEFEYGLLPPGKYKENIDYIYSNLIVMDNKDSNQEIFSIKPNLPGKFFKRNVLENAKWELPKEIFFGEDGVVVYSAILKSMCVIKLDEAYYHYVQHESSASHKRNLKIFENIEFLYNTYIEIFKGNKFENSLLEQLNKYIKVLCGFALNRLYNISFGNKYTFDFGMLLNKKNRIVLYGAGRVGCDYIEVLEKSSNIEVVRWVDKNYLNKPKNVSPVDSIFEEKFDFVIIAVAYEYVAAEIITDLVNKGIDEKKIIWNKPLREII